jgi:hypothetical protein
MNKPSRAPRPNYTQAPNVFFDVWAPQLTEGELRVALYVIRRTFGFQKEADAISFTQLCEGIVTHDGRRLDHGTGMARSSVNRAIKGLEEKGLLHVDRSAGRSKDTTTYSLIFEDDPDSATVASDGGSSAKLLPSSEKRLGSSDEQPGWYPKATTPGSEGQPAVVAESDLQKKPQNKDQNKVEQNVSTDDFDLGLPETDPILTAFRAHGGIPSATFATRTGHARTLGRQSPRLLTEALGRLRYLPDDHRRDEVRWSNALASELHTLKVKAIR